MSADEKPASATVAGAALTEPGEAPVPRDLRHHARMRPHHVAVVQGRDRVSYADLESRANRLAAALRAHGVRRGDHVAMRMGNRCDTLALGWAAWRCGAYLTPMATTLTVTELAYLVRDSNATVVIGDGQLGPSARSLALALIDELGPEHAATWLSLGGDLPGHTPLEPDLVNATPGPIPDEAPGALMMYTSGTTGSPKGVIRPLLAPGYRGPPPFAGDLLDLFDLDGPDVRYLSTAPLHHAAPLRTALAVTAGGGTVHLMDRFDAEQALGTLEAEGITHSQWVPSMFQRLLDLSPERRARHHAPAHRLAIHGAAPCPAELKREMIDWWGPILLEYYSGTEGIGLTLIDSHEALARPGSVGRARKGRLHVVDDQGCELPAGQTGLVCFSGTPPFAYHRAPEKTASRTLAGGLQTFGDLGHVDAEGWLYLTDRLDDMIISGGVNVYPQEVEAVIRQVSGVWDCAVVGWPDERFGERPVAFVVPRRDASDRARLTLDIADRCRLRLSRIKQPEQIHLVAELPRSTTGKLLRRHLRAERHGEDSGPREGIDTASSGLTQGRGLG